MGDLKEAPAVHFNFPLLSFSLYITFKSGLPLPVSLFLRNRGGLVIALHGLKQPHNPSSMVWLLLLLETVFVCLLIFCEQTVQNGVLPSFKCTVCTVCGCA